MFQSQCRTSGCLQGNLLDEHKLGLYSIMAANVADNVVRRGGMQNWELFPLYFSQAVWSKLVSSETASVAAFECMLDHLHWWLRVC